MRRTASLNTIPIALELEIDEEIDLGAAFVRQEIPFVV